MENSKNLIIIFASEIELNEYQLNCNRDAFKGKTVLEFRSFDENYATIKEKLQKLNKDNFIVLTVKEGSRGVDYKGPSPAHVIICYAPASYADCVQALSRGCRTLDQFSEGTILCKQPLTEDPSEYLSLLEMRDIEIQEGLTLNSKVAKQLHSWSYTGTVLIDTVAEFQQFMEENKDFTKETHDADGVLWQKLK